jgi:hypothetical protein
MKNQQLNQSSVKISKKFDQQLHDMLLSDLKNVKSNKNVIRTLNVSNDLMVA